MSASIPVSHVARLANEFKTMSQRITSLERALARRGAPPATYIEGAWTVAPPGYLLMGQTIVNAATLYPNLWAAAPIGWRSGTSLVLPVRADAAIKT